MQSADDIFLEARQIADAAARAAFLAEACGENPNLRQQVEAMLRDAAAADNFFDLPENPAVPTSGLHNQAGTVVGRYKLLEKIGEGGFGTVYVAQQKEPVKRQVALKIIKPGMDSRQVVARFEAERQALALMDHPNIAKVFDGGATDTGRPYFVMELVRGVPITDYCDENRLSPRERLELFMRVCQAVQHAHQKGIIHRDLKPSNILVTVNDGVAVPKVIDFGVAKATQQELTEKTILTHFHQFIGTPAYMSPEQAEMTSVDIDTRSDIYSLGVLLYELLTGKTPFEGKELMQAGLDELRRTIREKEPLRPSTKVKNLRGDELTTTASRRRTEAPKLIELLRNDLDWIVMKCLEKDRARRYDAANNLAADLERHLNNEPVLARPPSATYRFEKLLRRNKLQFASAATIALVLIAASVVSIRHAAKSRQAEQIAREEAIKATKAQQKATEEAETAKAIKEFLLKNLIGVDCCGDSVEPDAASFEATLALVQKVASRMEGQFTNQPQVEAEIREVLMRGLGSARDHREIAIQAERLVELHRRISGPYHSNTLTAINGLAYAWSHVGRRDEGMRLLVSTMEAVRPLPPQVKGPLRGLEGTYGLLLIEEGRTAEALPYLREALAAARAFNPRSNDSRVWASALADALDSDRQWAESEALWRETFESCLRDLGPTNPQTLDKQFGLVRLLVSQRRDDEALPILETLIASFQMRFGSNYFSTIRAQCWQAMALDHKGDTAAVARLYMDLHPRLMKYVPHHFNARLSFEEMADFFVRQRNYAQAKAAYEPLRTIFEARPPEDSAQFQTYIRAAAATKGWPAAAKIYGEYGDRFTESVSQARARATALLYAGDSDAYRHVVAKVLTSASSTNDWNEQQHILNIVSLGATAFLPEQVNHCEALVGTFARGLESATEQQQASGHRALGGILFRLGRLTNSLEHLEIAEKKYSGSQRARVLFVKSLCLHRLGRPQEARTTFDEAEALSKRRLLKQLDDFEGFLTADERTCLILRREAQALLCGN
jgi:serine/threonine protein kinase